MPTLSLPIVSSCSVDSCGFNHDGCRAGAITVSGSHAACGAFSKADAADQGPVPASVTACDRTDCVHNDVGRCSAKSIAVGASFDTADCLTFELRS